MMPSATNSARGAEIPALSLFADIHISAPRGARPADPQTNVARRRGQRCQRSRDCDLSFYGPSFLTPKLELGYHPMWAARGRADTILVASCPILGHDPDHHEALTR